MPDVVCPKVHLVSRNEIPKQLPKPLVTADGRFVQVWPLLFENMSVEGQECFVYEPFWFCVRKSFACHCHLPANCETA